MTEVIRTPEEMMQWRKKWSRKSVGFVPTMGALHSGHESLLKKAREENEACVLSIFVNPTQFNDQKDYEKYPLTWDADKQLAQKHEVDVVFAPTFEAIYPDGYKFKVSENNFSLDLCGKDRPGHFDGVLSIVMKLFNIVQPHRAYFGEKDFQQLKLIEDMAKAFFLPVQIVPMPTVREKDGLALSSRNVHLTAEQRQQAPIIYKVISQSQSAQEAEEKLKSQNWLVDYVKDLQGRRYVAVRVGEVRLIDNVKI